MSANFNEIINNSTPTLVDFYATWCGPCKMMTPILEELKRNVGDKVKIIKVDVDKYPSLANEYRVQGVPTMILFQNGEIKWKDSGVRQAKVLQQIIEKNTTLN